jgi:hypothetical protein
MFWSDFGAHKMFVRWLAFGGNFRSGGVASSWGTILKMWAMQFSRL